MFGLTPREVLDLTPREYHAYVTGYNKKFRLEHGLPDESEAPALDAKQADRMRRSWIEDAEKRRQRDGLD